MLTVGHPPQAIEPQYFVFLLCCHKFCVVLFLLHRAPCDKMLSYATPSERVISFISHLYNCLPCRRGDDHLNKETMSKLVILVWLRILTSGMMKCNSAKLLFSLNPAQKKRNTAHKSGAMLMLSWCRGSWNRPGLTSCRQLFGVDYFGGILLTRTQLNTSAHHWKGSPVKHKETKPIR